jgi:peroxiredoxin
MKRLMWALAGLIPALALAAMVALPVQAGEKGVEIGEAVPDFELTDHTGGKQRLSDYKGKVVVLQFISKNCPWSRGVDPDVSTLAKKYQEKGVVFLGIDADKANSVDDLAGHAKSVGFPFTLVKDNGTEYADKLNATRTPEVYIVNPEGKLVFHGAYDDRKTPTTAGDLNYVAKALDEVLEGKDVSTPKVAAWGCVIRR